MSRLKFPSLKRPGSERPNVTDDCEAVDWPATCLTPRPPQNNPIYIRNFGTAYPDLKFHYIAHTSCDVIEERVVAASKLSEMYLGMLFAMEDLAVYGYMTNTRVKFIVVLTMTDAIIKDVDMKALFRRIHACYIAHVSNPFYDHSKSHDLMKSRQFAKSMELIAGFT